MATEAVWLLDEVDPKVTATTSGFVPLFTQLQRAKLQAEALAGNYNVNVTATVPRKWVPGAWAANGGRGNVFGAEGAIVNRPTMALIGEAGPEAVRAVWPVAASPSTWATLTTRASSLRTSAPRSFGTCAGSAREPASRPSEDRHRSRCAR